MKLNGAPRETCVHEHAVIRNIHFAFRGLWKFDDNRKAADFKGQLFGGFDDHTINGSTRQASDDQVGDAQYRTMPHIAIDAIGKDRMHIATLVLNRKKTTTVARQSSQTTGKTKPLVQGDRGVA